MMSSTTTHAQQVVEGTRAPDRYAGPAGSSAPFPLSFPMTMPTILVVDDEPKIVELARDYLEQAGFDVRAASDGEAAFEAFRRFHPDLIALDLGLPRMDGLDVVRRLRRDSDVPVIIITARGEETDRIVGLELGADDYLVKPFSPKELVARVRAVLRRGRAADQPEVLRRLDLEIDTGRMKVRRGETVIELTPAEFQLLAALARQPGRIFTRGQLLEALHGVAFESYERAIDTHIKNLRKKIELDPRRPRYIETVYGVGYRLAEA
jgi:two-component system alkaline phosphatase synthesis response regulator PhoP